MKITSRALIMCTAIAAISNAYAINVDLIHPPVVPVKSQYPMIEQYAPEAIKEVCQRRSIIPCPECEAAERMLWCAKKIGKSLDGFKENPELFYYCEQCFSFDNPNQNLIVKIIDAIAHKASLNNDEAFALLKEFNRAVAQAQKDGTQEKITYLHDLAHPN